MEDCLPKKIVWRKDKVGFETPQEKWLRSKWVEEIKISTIEKTEN